MILDLGRTREQLKAMRLDIAAKLTEGEHPNPGYVRLAAHVQASLRALDEVEAESGG